ncbi:UNVERIFIED_CONTAM: hypothetical protein GTU68_006797 [Idotea baltica]|nr:hypothetical protein [Idotea baltica]
MKLTGKNIVVTGAGGFIGSHLVELLLKRGANIKALVRYNSTSKAGWLDTLPSEVKSNIEIVFGDIRDSKFIENITKKQDLIFHLAALIGIPYSYSAPTSYVSTNIEGTLNVLEAANKNNISKVIHTSTSEVYGSAQYVPINESHPIQPQSPYAASKASADYLASSYYLSFETPVSTVRPFNSFGPRQSARAVIPTIITQLMKGETIKMGALDTTRDFTFVEDTAEGFIAVAESDKSLGEVINIGSEFEVSIEEVINLIAGIMKVDPKIEIDNTRVRPKQSEVTRLHACSSKAKSLTTWTPRNSGKLNFASGLEKTIRWFENSNNFKLINSEGYIV